MTKIDHKKELKQLYSAAAKQPAFVEVPTLNYLRIDTVNPHVPSLIEKSGRYRPNHS